jgi:hypothetical protein
VKLVKEAKITYPIGEAINPGRNVSTSMSPPLYSISPLRIAPPKGDLKIEPIPAPMPTATAILLSFEESLNTSAINEPKPAPICAVGPSLPPLPPEPIVREEAIALTTGTLFLILPSLL